MPGQGPTSERNDLFGELKAFVETLKSASENGASVERTLRFGSSEGETGGVMGVRVQTGIGGITETVRERVEAVQSEPEEDPSEVRRPAVDVYEEDQHVRVVAEMPGVGKDDLAVTVEDGALVLSAETDRHRYWRAVSLPEPVASDEYTLRVQNGLVELDFARDESQDAAPED
jgi:HSP20 family protein